MTVGFAGINRGTGLSRNSVTVGSEKLVYNTGGGGLFDESVSDFNFAVSKSITGVTFTRGSSATYFDSNPFLVSAGNNTARFTHTLAGASLGLLIEGSRTTHCRNSDDVSGTGWSDFGSGATVTGSQSGGPEEAATATQVEFNGQFDSWRQDFTNSADSQNYTMSFYGKLLTGNANITMHHEASETGTFTADQFTFTASLQLLSGSFLGKAAGGLLRWGWQDRNASGHGNILVSNPNLEAGDFPSSYIENTGGAGSSVTRSADTATLSSSGIVGSIGTIYVSGRTALGTSGDQVVWQADDGDENERIRIVRDSSDVMRCIVTNGGVEQANLNLGAVADDTAFTVALAFQASDFAANLDGGAEVTDSAGTVPTVTTIRLGQDSSGNHMFGTIARATVWSRFLTDAERQSL